MTWASVVIAALRFVSWFGRWAERMSGRLQGRAEQKLANAEEQLEQAKKANENAEAVRRMSDGELDAKLRSDARK